MGEEAVPSCSEEAASGTGGASIDESKDESFASEEAKEEFTNALLAANAIYDECNLLSNNPPKTVSSVSLAMAEEISKATIDVLNEYFISTEEELILAYESDDEEFFQHCTDDPMLDEEYDPDDYEEPSAEYIPLAYKAKVVAIAQAHPKWSLAVLQKNGASRLKRKDHIKRWTEDVKNGGTRIDKLREIDSQTFERFQEARSCYEQVTTRTLQQWAMAAAFPFLSGGFHFEASQTWVKVFKRKHGIRQRKITKYISKRDVATLQETVEIAERFRTQTRFLIPKFDLDFVINTDQTGCQYQTTYNRSLDFKGAKTVYVKKQNLNKITHSYTAQYTVTASGKLLPKVFICLQETSNKFGPIVSKTVDRLTAEFKNVVVCCSKSGKLTKELYRHYLQTILVPYVKDERFMLLIDSWGGQTDCSLHDEIFNNEEGEATCSLKFIPPKCMPLCQPCDVYFYRQVKLLIKRLQNAPILLKEQREIASREDAIKIQSLVLHQLSAPKFNNMLKYAWYAAKLTESRVVFQNVNEICFPLSLLNKNCACNSVAFILCAWCEKNLCFTCFYDKYHPHDCTGSADNEYASNSDDC